MAERTWWGMKRKKERKLTSEKGISAFLGRDTEFVGKLVFNGVVRVDGKFSGDIFSSGNLLVGEGAVINAEIKVDTIIISGCVKGNIDAKSKIELCAPGKLLGNIRTPALIINEGAVFEGNCQMAKVKGGDGKIAVVEDFQEKKEEKGGI